MIILPELETAATKESNQRPGIRDWNQSLLMLNLHQSLTERVHCVKFKLKSLNAAQVGEEACQLDSCVDEYQGEWTGSYVHRLVMEGNYKMKESITIG